MKKHKKLLLALFTIIVLFFPASTFLYGADKKADTKNPNNNKDKFVKIVVKVKVPDDFFGASFEVQYKAGYGKQKVEQLIDKNILVFIIKSTIHKKEENLIEASKLDYKKYLMLEYMVKVSQSKEYEGKIVCGGFNSFQLFPSSPLSKIIINIDFHEERSSFICSIDYISADDRSN